MLSHLRQSGQRLKGIMTIRLSQNVPTVNLLFLYDNNENVVRFISCTPSASKVDASPFRSPRGLDGAEPEMVGMQALRYPLFSGGQAGDHPSPVPCSVHFCGGVEALVCWSGFEIISCSLDLEADSSKASAELWLLRFDGWRSGLGLFTKFSLLFCTSKNQSITSVVQRLDHLIQSCHLLISGIALVLVAM